MWGRQTWLIGLPMLLVGSELGQWVLHRFLRTAHGQGGSIDAAPLALRLSAPVLGVAVIVGLVLVAWRPTTASFSRRIFASLPLCVFAVQEHLEYVMAHGSRPWTVSLHWWFMAGLLIQVPFVLLSYAAARTLIRVAAKVFAPRSPPLRIEPKIPAVPRLEPCHLPTRARPLGDARFNRGPPLPAL